MMSLETWLLISMAILASQYAAIKMSERRPVGWSREWSEPTTPLEQIQIHEEAVEEIPSSNEAAQAEEFKREEILNQEPAAAESREEQSQVEKPANTPQEIPEIELLAARMSELEELLKMSEELKKELQKLAETLDPAKHAKELIRAGKKRKLTPR